MRYVTLLARVDIVCCIASVSHQRPIGKANLDLCLTVDRRQFNLHEENSPGEDHYPQ